MGTFSVTLDAELERALDVRGARESASRAELVRQALVHYLNPALAVPAVTASALEQAGDLVGCFTGSPADLSANPRYLDDFGRV
jgi:plasmid stability protein